MAIESKMAQSYMRHLHDGSSDWFGVVTGAAPRKSGDSVALAEGFRIVAGALLDSFGDEYIDAYLLCESPIEELMFVALWGTGLRKKNVHFRSKRWAEGEIRGPGRLDVSHFIIEPQHQIGCYRVDFMVEFRRFEFINGDEGRRYRSRYVDSTFLIVECDGHNFHEKTKEQAQSDKTRDRELSKLGYKVFHYTGSEVWNDAYRCAKEALEELERLAVQR